MADRSTLVKLDLEPIRLAILNAVTQTIYEAAEYALESAKEDAPVRKIFRSGKQGRQPRRRALTGAEAVSELRLRGQLGLAPAIRTGHIFVSTIGHRNRLNPALPFAGRRSPINAYVTPYAHRVAHLGERGVLIHTGREVGHLPQGGLFLRNPLARRDLSARGRYELAHPFRRNRQGQIIGGLHRSTETGLLQVGGRLRDEITMTEPQRDGALIKASVSSPTYYAKYQEFGTRHNRAHPYLRPAIAKLQNSYRNRMLNGLQRALKPFGTVTRGG